MKRIAIKIISFCCALIMMAGLVPSSYAVSDSYVLAMKLLEKPGMEDLAMTGDDEKVTVPPGTEFLDEYEWVFISSAYGEGAYVYQSPCTDYLCQQGVVFHRTRVALIATYDNYYCLIRYYNENDGVRTGWIPKKFISEEYPQEEFYSGFSYEYIGAYWKQAQQFGEESEDFFPGTEVKYVTFGDIPYVQTLKIRYTITSANGVDDPCGKYRLYLYDGKHDHWCKSSVFDVTRLNKPEEVTVYFQYEPQNITAIAVLPLDASKQGASFDLYAVDILI